MILFCILSCLLHSKCSYSIFENKLNASYYDSLSRSCPTGCDACDLAGYPYKVFIGYTQNNTDFMFLTQLDDCETNNPCSVSINSSENKMKGAFAMTERNGWFEFRSCDGTKCLSLNTDLEIEATNCDQTHVKQRFKVHFINHKLVHIYAWNGERIYFAEENAPPKADGLEEKHGQRNFILQAVREGIPDPEL